MSRDDALAELKYARECVAFCKQNRWNSDVMRLSFPQMWEQHEQCGKYAAYHIYDHFKDKVNKLKQKYFFTEQL